MSIRLVILSVLFDAACPTSRSDMGKWRRIMFFSRLAAVKTSFRLLFTVIGSVKKRNLTLLIVAYSHHRACFTAFRAGGIETSRPQNSLTRAAQLYIINKTALFCRAPIIPTSIDSPQWVFFRHKKIIAEILH
jgi:hypothetical protein